MFLKTTVFKKLIKSAWNGHGLTVGRNEEGIFLEGGYWIIRVKEDSLPNKEKAAIIELTGELPEEGEVFKAMKDIGNQYEIDQNEVWKIGRQKSLAENSYIRTNILLKQHNTICRVLKNEETGKCILIDEMFINLLDYEAIEWEKESEPEGPVALGEEATVLYWGNEICTLAVYTRAANVENYEPALLEAIQKIDM